ncbi:MAG: HD domain-containing protein [Gemmatimonadetes bacterium]|nr:HD domain-containing protein [Gemmatimonadota bacterium]
MPTLRVTPGESVGFLGQSQPTSACHQSTSSTRPGVPSLSLRFSRFQGYVVSCVRHHHERWDGRGYPDGIAGMDIPLGARIITIADTIDAMTTNRPYRGALSLEAVVSELNKCRGGQFDAELVELTVNSVTVRRLICDPSLVPEYLPSPKSVIARARRFGAAPP